jgi:outer membrane protein OmpA-like peptidoglycan-associated protein
MNIKTISASVIFLLGAALSAPAQKISSVTADGARLSRDGSSVVVDMNLDISALQLKSTQAVLLTPCIVNGSDSLALPSVGIYGRQRYYYYLRRDGNMLSGKDETTLRDGNLESVIPYHAAASYSDWMNGSELILMRRDYSCCEKVTDSQEESLLRRALYEPVRPAVPSVRYMTPEATVADAVKTREVSGRADVIFPVNKVTIYPALANNTAELGKIRASIDSVRLDDDVTVTAVTLTGYASPEGKYSNNERLASGRTDAIRDYILSFADFDKSMIGTECVPEDWDGFIAWLKVNTVSDRDTMLEIAESGLAPDQKEQKLRQRCPETYNDIVKELFPTLRRTEYRIRYAVRSFSDPAEILNVMRTRPDKLSLQEFYLAANSLQPGSAEFSEVYETAACIYPDDPAVNINAASAAIENGEYKRAGRYLDRAGDSGEAAWARGVLAAGTGNYAEAAEQFRKAAASGIEGAARAAQDYENYLKDISQTNN